MLELQNTILASFLELRKDATISYLEHSLRYEEAVFKALLLANGGAVAILGSTLGSLIERGGDIIWFKASIALFVFGLIYSGILYFLAARLTSDKVDHYYDQFLKLINGELKTVQLTNYNFSPAGQRKAIQYGAGSTLFFISGIITALIGM